MTSSLKPDSRPPLPSFTLPTVMEGTLDRDRDQLVERKSLNLYLEGDGDWSLVLGRDRQGQTGRL